MLSPQTRGLHSLPTPHNAKPLHSLLFRPSLTARFVQRKICVALAVHQIPITALLLPDYCVIRNTLMHFIMAWWRLRSSKSPLVPMVISIYSVVSLHFTPFLQLYHSRRATWTTKRFEVFTSRVCRNILHQVPLIIINDFIFILRILCPSV